MKRIFSLLLALILCFSLTAAVFAAEKNTATDTATQPTDADQTDSKDDSQESAGIEKPLIICLDPGHGSTDPGACATYGGVEYHEADLVLKIGLYLREYLQQYKNVLVIMTRENNNGDPSVIIPDKIAPRVEYGVARSADVVVSLHLNANEKTNIHGATMLISNRNYRPEVADVAIAIGDNILVALKNLGLLNRGRLFQNSQDYRNPDGSVADYYGIVRAGIWRGVPSFIVEHCYLTNEDDFRNYLSSDEKLAALAKADADGIAAYYGLERKDEGDPVDPLEGQTYFLDCFNHWAKSIIETAVAEGWVKGYPGHMFGPNDSLTRADFVTMLRRMSGEDEPTVTKKPFPDCALDTYYTANVAWAVDAKIVAGYDDGLFHPTDRITREQMAHIMVNYLHYKGYDTFNDETSAVAAKMDDYDTISDWAKPDVCFCYEVGLLNGNGHGFAPKDGALRGEACKVLLNLHQYTEANPLPADDAQTPDQPQETEPDTNAPDTNDDPAAETQPESGAESEAEQPSETDAAPAAESDASEDAAPADQVD